MKKYLLLLLMLFSFFSYAGMTPPPAPTCNLQMDCPDYETGKTYKCSNYSCEREWSIYRIQKQKWDEAYANGSNANYDGIKEPVKPTSKNCQNEDYACSQSEQQELSRYYDQKRIYDLQQQQRQVQNQQQDSKYSTVNSYSTADTYSEMKDKNNSASTIYQMGGSIAGSIGSQHVMQAMSCSASGCSAPEMAKAAAWFGVMGIAMSQSGRMDNSAYQACLSGNATSSSQANCGLAPAGSSNPYSINDPNNPTYAELNSDGTCKNPGSTACKNLTEAANRTGSNLSDLAKAKEAAAKSGLKITPDGKVTLPNGYKTDVASLMTKEGLMAAGVSAADADALLKQFASKTGLADADVAKDLKDLNNLNTNSLAGASGSSPGGSESSSSGQLNGDIKDANGKKKRGLAGEGLTKVFNGEQIGASGDDIFSMMTRRYQLKTAQDSFIGH